MPEIQGNVDKRIEIDEKDILYNVGLDQRMFPMAIQASLSFEQLYQTDRSLCEGV